MTVWVIHEGAHEDYGIAGIYANEEAANRKVEEMYRKYVVDWGRSTWWDSADKPFDKEHWMLFGWLEVEETEVLE